MTVNTDKTVYQFFTLSTKQHLTTVKYKNCDLSRQNCFRYIGVTLDNKLSWRRHVEKGASRLSLLKRLSGVTWGFSPETLATTYKTYVRPVLDYGGELLAIASDCCGVKVDRVRNKALRRITSAACSTPITTLEIQTGIEPMKVRKEKQLLKQYEKCKRLPLKHWRQLLPANKRLKTHQTFFSKSYGRSIVKYGFCARKHNTTNQPNLMNIGINTIS
ncbi:hypothetical protein AVEN_116215-1 [Araneus ventricosus]|uniref:Uncharacterized protein n=1 Tax=Araneus ventricosus TaxID=182803 RepID=A0A4Y2UXH7_ARAVE|nr:hypothetical protein AVEN_116215-1 [Araneus ventricosus]